MCIFKNERKSISRSSIEFAEYTCWSIHTFGCSEFITWFIARTRQIDDTFDSDLDYELGTFVARRHDTIESGSLHVSSHRIEYSICFCMDYVSMFWVIELDEVSLCIFPSGMWKFIIRASSRKTIVSNTYYPIMRIDNTGSYFCTGIFTSLSWEESKSHKILIPSYSLCHSSF